MLSTLSSIFPSMLDLLSRTQSIHYCRTSAFPSVSIWRKIPGVEQNKRKNKFPQRNTWISRRINKKKVLNSGYPGVKSAWKKNRSYNMKNLFAMFVIKPKNYEMNNKGFLYFSFFYSHNTRHIIKYQHPN